MAVVKNDDGIYTGRLKTVERTRRFGTVAAVDAVSRAGQMVGVDLAVLVGAAAFATLSLLIASLARARDRSMGIWQVLATRLFVARNAHYPLAVMPPWLLVVARLTPSASRSMRCAPR